MTSVHNKIGIARLAALALGAVMAVSGQHAEAATVTSSGVTGGCATGIVAPPPIDAGVIDVLHGASWDATFFNNEAAGTCFFTLTNPSSSAVAATVSVATVNQNGLKSATNSWGFEGGVTLTSPQLTGGIPPFELWRLAEGQGGFRSFTFNIAPNDFAFFDWNWGQAYASNLGVRPNIDFVVSATPVPLPAAGWLMIAGLGGLAALRRRKRAA